MSRQRPPWTLRARLVALLLLLLTTATLVIGTVTVLALRHSLEDQVDSALRSAAGRTSTNAAGDPTDGDHDHGGRGDGNGPRFLAAPGTSEGMLGAVLESGSVVSAATIDRRGASAPASDAVAEVLRFVPSGQRPRTYELPGIGAYQVVATESSSGQVLVMGLPLAAAQATERQLALVAVAVGAGWLLVAGLTGGLLVRRTLRPLGEVVAAASAVARLPLDRGEVELPVRVPVADPRTEVGQVGAAVNAMLGHVQRSLELRHASEERVRGFVADASHELRTPLASIRGYAELTRRSPDPVPPDVARGMQRIESEAIRMTSLVEELLLLARLDAGRPVQRRPVDLSMLLVDAVSDAQVAGPDHHWRLTLPDEPVVVHGDAQQLHQIVTNLLANARTHTPAGTNVEAALRTTAGAAELSVADDGPGVPPALVKTVFERFVRGEGSRTRAHGSTGLGLAIVASIAAAHRGSADVESRPGRTVFTVRVPTS